MKKLISLIALAVLGIILPSCSTDKDPEAEGNHRHQNEAPKVYTYKLSFGGDYIDQSEEPLTREQDNNKSYVGINVIRKPKGVTDASTEKYAYGLFTSTNDINITLISGYTYDFEVTVLSDKTDSYKAEDGYSTPFKIKTTKDTEQAAQPFNPDKTGDFIYTYDPTEYPTETSKPYLFQIASGTSYIDVSNYAYTSFGNYDYPRVDRFYGIKTNFDPSSLAASNEISIDLGYKCFGLRIEIEHMPAGTSLTWRDITAGEEALKNGNWGYFLQFPKDISLVFENNRTYEDIYSLNDLKQDSKIFTLEFTWHKGGGNVEEFKENFKATAKMRKIIRINIDGESNIEMTGNIRLNISSTELNDDEILNITKKFR